MLEALLANGLVIGLLGVVTGALFWKILTIIWDYFKVTKKLEASVEGWGYKIGKSIYKNAIVKITDINAREKAVKELDLIPDYFNKGFDKGIKNL